VTPLGALGLFAAGLGGGFIGSVAGLASLVSYPALLAAGLPPVTANVTNTIALVFSTTGSVLGSRPELTGRRAYLTRLSIAGIIGGLAGGVLLLVTPADSFEAVVPWLIALASVAILARRRLVDGAVHAEHHTSRGLAVGVGLIGVYGGYFGAGAGVMLLALLLFATGDTLPRANAVKSFVLGVANGVAAIVFVIAGEVRWNVVPPLAVGLFIGGRAGPMVVRRSPPAPLRAAIALAGLGLAAKLAFWP
jgi:uncharacterized membrane protein YfcA